MRMKRRFLFFLLLMSALASCVPGLCPVESLIITEKDLPAGSTIEPLQSHIAEWPYESAGVGAGYKGSLILHEVGRYPTMDAAKEEFNDAKKRASGQTETTGPWGTPPALTFKTSVFQDYYVACADLRGLGYQCRLIARYQEYYVFAFAYIEDTGITLSMFNDLIQKIDARMGACAR